MITKLHLYAALLLLLVLPTLAPAPALANERPEWAEITPQNSPSFPMTDSLQLEEIASIMMWVKPKWGAIDYDPALLSATGRDGVCYAVVMTRQKDGIGIYSGEDWDFVEFDFSDGKAHPAMMLTQKTL